MTQLVPAIFAILACTCFYILRTENKYKAIVWAGYIFLLVTSIYLFADKIIYRFNNPAVWDFTSFYLWGKVGASGHDFYLPQYSQEIYNSLRLPALNYDTFIADIVNVGFLYPPPTMFYFAPLSFLSYDSALIAWTVFNLIFLIASIRLTYILFLKTDKLNGLFLVIILFLIFSPVRSTVFFSQTNFILLYLLLLMKKHADSKYAGILLTLAIFTKPYMAVFFVYFLFKKNWPAIYYFLASTVMILCLTVVVFGSEIFYSFLFNNATKRLPQGAFLEDINQSLHSILLRARLINFDKPELFVAIALVLVIATLGYVVYLTKRKKYGLIWIVLLLIALILYPGTLGYYGVLLLFIIFSILKNSQQSQNWQYIITIGIIAITYFFAVEHLFAANCFLLFIILLIHEGQFILKKSLFKQKTTNL